MHVYNGIIFWAFLVLGFIISYLYKKQNKYIDLNRDLSLLNYKFIDINDKCYKYELKKINCNK